MKVLFVEQQYTGGTLFGDGVAQVTIEVSQQLVKAGHEVHVLSCFANQERRDEEIAGVHVHFRPEVKIRGLSRIGTLPGIRPVRDLLWRDGELWHWLRLSLSVYVEYRRLGFEPDVIESSTYPRSTLFMALFRPRPLVLTAHLPGWKPISKWLDRDDYVAIDEGGQPPLRMLTRLADFVTRFQGKRASAFVVPAQIVADAYRFEPIYASIVPDMLVAGYGIDPRPWADTADVGTSAPIVVQVGSVEHRKASEVLVDAGAILAPDFPGLQIVFVGRSVGLRDGLPYADSLAQHAEAIGSPCTFVGAIPRDELAAWHSKARVVAMPSWFDTYPLAGLEGLAAGRPLVCSNGIGYASIVAEAGAGAVVAVGDAQALADALRRYLSDPQEAARAGAAARELMTTGALSIDATLGQRLSIYELAAARG